MTPDRQGVIGINDLISLTLEIAGGVKRTPIGVNVRGRSTCEANPRDQPKGEVRFRDLDNIGKAGIQVQMDGSSRVAG